MLRISRLLVRGCRAPSCILVIFQIVHLHELGSIWGFGSLCPLILNFFILLIPGFFNLLLSRNYVFFCLGLFDLSLSISCSVRIFLCRQISVSVYKLARHDSIGILLIWWEYILCHIHLSMIFVSIVQRKGSPFWRFLRFSKGNSIFIHCFFHYSFFNRFCRLDKINMLLVAFLWNSRF